MQSSSELVSHISLKNTQYIYDSSGDSTYEIQSGHQYHRNK